MKGNKLVEFLIWAMNDGVKFREFGSVKDVHYFLNGYQSAESHNSIGEGEGAWISDFMEYCEKRKDDLFKSGLDCQSGVSYHQFILLNQKSDQEGLQVFFKLFSEFLSHIY